MERKYAKYFFSLQTVFVLLLLGSCRHVESLCTPPISGSWMRTDGVTPKVVTFTGSDLNGHQIGTNTVYEDLVCAFSSGSRYVYSMANFGSGPGGESKGFVCWQIVPLSSHTALLYQLTSTTADLEFINQRVHAQKKDTPVPSIDQVCSLNSNDEFPTILYKVSSTSATEVDVSTASASRQRCSPEVFAVYSYVKDGSGCQGSDSDLDICSDRSRPRANYTQCAEKILYSDNGVLSCLGSFTRGADTYQFMMNEDAAVSGSFKRFVCVKVSKTGTTETAVVHADSCTGTPTHTLDLTRTRSCPIEDEPVDDSDITPIIVGVVIALLVIAAIIVIIVLYKKGKICRRRRAITPTTQDRKHKPATDTFAMTSETTPRQNGTSGPVTSAADGTPLHTSSKLPPIPNSSSGAATAPAEETAVTSPSKLPPISPGTAETGSVPDTKK